jgi:hypothetical protein
MQMSCHVVVADGWLAHKVVPVLNIGSFDSQSGKTDAEPAEVAELTGRVFGRIGYLAMFGSTDRK